MLAVAGNQTDSVVIADFNGDDKPDIAVANNYGRLSVLLGNGNGTFQPFTSRRLPNSTGENFLATGDFNGDNVPDLAVANGIFSKLTVLTGKGTGKFAIGASAPIGEAANDVAVADFNHDGKLDLAVSDGTGDITVLLGNGDGTFGTPEVYQVGIEADALTTGDVDGDGVPDILFTSHGYYGYGYVGVLLNNGDGTFKDGNGYATPAKYPHGVVAGDFHGDGVDDVAAADSMYNAIDFLTNTTNEVPPALEISQSLLATLATDETSLKTTLRTEQADLEAAIPAGTPGKRRFAKISSFCGPTPTNSPQRCRVILTRCVWVIWIRTLRNRRLFRHCLPTGRGARVTMKTDAAAVAAAIAKHANFSTEDTNLVRDQTAAATQTQTVRQDIKLLKADVSSSGV